MAKKIKRKVTQGRQASSQVLEPVVETAAASEGSAAPAARTGYTRASRASMSSADFNPDYTHIIKDLKRIGTLAGAFFVILIVLSFFI
ncbi:MAG: hypothetical protein GX491_13965 [Chloroflexi bacterium]|nr:hypothetical protein [Chloroflexota bacterium]